jgi:hypothetical protein
MLIFFKLELNKEVVMISFLSLATGLCAVLAGLGFVYSWLTSFTMSAPQQAAFYAGCLTLAVVPYVLLRAVMAARQQEQNEKMLKLLASLRPTP